MTTGEYEQLRVENAARLLLAGLDIWGDEADRARGLLRCRSALEQAEGDHERGNAIEGADDDSLVARQAFHLKFNERMAALERAMVRLKVAAGEELTPEEQAKAAEAAEAEKLVIDPASLKPF